MVVFCRCALLLSLCSFVEVVAAGRCHGSLFLVVVAVVVCGCCYCCLVIVVVVTVVVCCWCCLYCWL